MFDEGQKELYASVSERPGFVERGKERFTKENLAFWNGLPPEEVVLATASVRKSLMWMILNSGSVCFYGDKGGDSKLGTENSYSPMPLDLGKFSEVHIGNGNGTLEKKTFLGYLHGVPVYAHPQEGETESNNPYQEAVNKVTNLASLYQGEDVIIVGIDTVSFPDSAEEPVGKPENIIPGFPKRKDFPDDEASYWKAVSAAASLLEDFKETNYAHASVTRNINAIAILDSLSGQLVELNQNQAILTLPVIKELLKQASLSPDVAGGGIEQQLVWWQVLDLNNGGNERLIQQVEQIADYLKEFMDDLSQAGLTEYDLYRLQLLIYCQIAGMPYLAITTLLQETAHSNIRASQAHHDRAAYIEVLASERITNAQVA